MESFINWFMAGIGQHISKELCVLIVSMVPVVEERGGLLLARMLDLPLWKGALYAIIGNIIPIPFILLFLKKILHWMDEHHMSKIVSWLQRKADKNRPSIEKYGFWGLAIFVGIPLPGTGAWTGSLVASVFDMDLKQSSIAILIGIIIAAVIMCIVSYGALGALLG